MASKSIRASLRASLPSAGRATSTSDPCKLPPTLQSTATHDILYSVVKGRRSWKTLREGEIVWPPKLEAMLLEGLELYQPDDSRETRLLGRFPMRNRFISEYIFSKTGERRTARQVSSRLQQLRVTCNGKRLMNLLSPCRPIGPGLSQCYCTGLGRSTTEKYDSESAAKDTSNGPSAFKDIVANSQSYDPKLTTRIVICIDLLPEAPSGPGIFSFDQAPAPDGRSPLNPIRTAQHPRPLRSIDPTITFISRSPISARSYFTVESSGMPVFMETTPLVSVVPAPDGALLYSTTLVPGFWDKISESPDPTQYVIFQEVIQDGPTSSCLVFSAAYKFNYPSGNPHHHTYPSSMSSNSDEELHTRHDPQNNFFDCLISMDTAFPGMNCDSIEPFNNLSTAAAKGTWDVHLPSEIPVNQSSTYDQMHSCGKQEANFNCLPLPRSTQLGQSPTDLLNYASHPMDCSFASR